MAPKKNAASQKSVITTTTTTTTTSAPIVETTQKAKSDALAYSSIIQDIWSSYINTTPQSLKMIDIFMAFLVFTGVVQFAYCILVGNYPFNAFLSGFTATVGQFVLAGQLCPSCTYTTTNHDQLD